MQTLQYDGLVYVQPTNLPYCELDSTLFLFFHHSIYELLDVFSTLEITDYTLLPHY